MNKHAAIVAIVLSVTTVALPLPADAPTFLFEPTTIGAPGHYVVTRNISFAGTLFAIGADGVTVDLNGHVLTGLDGASEVIRVDGNAGLLEGVEIRGGVLKGGLHGVRATSSAKRRIRLEDLTIEATASDGIRVEDAKVVEIVACRVLTAGGVGIQLLSDDGQPFRGSLVDNHIQNTSTQAILVNGLAGGKIVGNVALDFGTNFVQGVGIQLLGGSAAGGNLLTRNRVGDSDDDWGISLESGSPHNALLLNVISGTGGRGISVNSDGNRLFGNQVSGAGNHGIFVAGSDNVIENSLIEENAGAGLFFHTMSSGNAYRGNMLRGNASGEVDDAGAVATDAGENILD